MKALTLWQPWATYIAVGAKRYETRSWGTSYRGPLAIHASRRPMTEGERELLSEWPLPFGSGEMPFGAVVATCELVDCFRMAGLPAPDAREDALGDWSPERWAWALVNVQRLDPPVPAKGAQGLWDWAARPEEGR